MLQLTHAIQLDTLETSVYSKLTSKTAQESLLLTNSGKSLLAHCDVKRKYNCSGNTRRQNNSCTAETVHIQQKISFFIHCNFSSQNLFKCRLKRQCFHIASRRMAVSFCTRSGTVRSERCVQCGCAAVASARLQMSTSVCRSSSRQHIRVHQSRRKVGKQQYLFRTTEPLLRIQPYQMLVENNEKCVTVYLRALLLIPRVLRHPSLSQNSGRMIKNILNYLFICKHYISVFDS